MHCGYGRYSRRFDCGSGVREHWKRILVGAVVGWVFAVVGGAFALASLEFHHLISRATSDELGIVLVLYGVGIGALNAYALRPAARAVKLDRDRLQEQIHELYRSEHEEMGERGTLERLERAREWDLAPTLAAGGVVVFPHAGVLDCGHQVAAAVHGCLDSGADRVVVISVLHAFTDEMQDARQRVSAGEDPVGVAVLGHPGSGHRRARRVASRPLADQLPALLGGGDEAARDRGPEVVERYPYLAGGHPERLPGIDELATLAEDAVIVSTADPFHHGIGYGDPPERALDPHEGGLELARTTIEEGIELLGRGDYAAYDAHCLEAKSDARDAGVVFRYLRGELRGEILDMTYTDAAALYESPDPTWVAAPLVEWRVRGARRARARAAASRATRCRRP